MPVFLQLQSSIAFQAAFAFSASKMGALWVFLWVLRTRLLKEVAFQAPFFRRFWLLVSPNAPREMICGDLDALELGAVGCAELNAGILVVRRNAAAQRSIEQQARLTEGGLEMGIPARGKAAP